MVSTTTSENIVKLRELSNKLCQYEGDKYKNMLIEIKNILDSATYSASDNKVNCYEKICSRIQIMLSTFKIT